MSATTSAVSTGFEARVRDAEARLAPVRAAYPFTPRFFEQPGGLQHFVDEGPRASSALVFLHGNPTWSFLWRRSIATLRDHYRCIAPDHIGCGLSDKPQSYPYTLERHIENAVRLVDSLALERITLVLHDWGGAIGMGLARRRPDLVERLVILNTAAFRSKRIPLRIAICRTPVFGRLAVRGLNAFARAATFMAVERPLSADVKRGYLLPYDSYANRIATHAFVEDIPLAEGHPSYAELTAIDEALDDFQDRPACILWGERDWCFTPWFREVWQRRLPQAEVHRFENAGHYLVEDAGEEVVERIRDFLGRTDVR